ncbi:HAD family hydrolase [Photobacterium sp. BZF1]|uniref:HAD family hydrolase n=1 Tax=Photobacterium sp. BZF1 TaxID=1904457 RepID=UPI001653DF2D|nr:HAD family hydrolase [Photobacterium sp. BZF1]MBC7003220.1 HAD family hydrolase [Photobacterium sp. BZF1]
MWLKPKAGTGGAMIFFDLDNTLLDHDGAEQDAICDFAKRYRDEIIDCPDGIEVMWRTITDEKRQQWRTGKLNFEGLRRARISALFRRPLSEELADRLIDEYYSSYRQYWRLFPDVQPALEKLRNVSPLAIITNGFTYHQEAKLKTTGIREFFSYLVISEQVGAAKPDPKIFQHALKQSGKSAAECWYIGNHPLNDATAASELGFKAVWLNRHNNDTKVPTRVVRSLEGLVDLVTVHY